VDLGAYVQPKGLVRRLLLAQPGGEPPLLVTGLPRSGTSWVGKMLQASGEAVYVNEPLNPRHPPGRSPGVLRADVTHQFQYISAADDAAWRQAYARTIGLRYGMVAELQRNRSRYDLARAGKYATSFVAGRVAGRRALLDDPYAFFSVAWFVRTFGCRVVVLVRRPESFVGSWQKLGWTIDFAELLGQPHLMADHLSGYADRMRAALTRPALDQAALLWAAAYDVASTAFGDLPGVQLVRYEDLADDPLPEFGALYQHMGLTWTPKAEEIIRSATSGATAPGTTKPESAFAWSLRGGPSRTAYTPMDSAAAAKAAASRLSADQVARVRTVTDPVAARFYP
jgi:Sulfotransferase family